jgi:hypothetical protein
VSGVVFMERSGMLMLEKYILFCSFSPHRI